MVLYPHSTISKSSPVDRDLSKSPNLSFKMKVHDFDLRIQEHTKHKEFLAPELETSKTADMEKKK